jgi:hypothetical protein
VGEDQPVRRTSPLEEDDVACLAAEPEEDALLWAHFDGWNREVTQKDLDEFKDALLWANFDGWDWEAVAKVLDEFEDALLWAHFDE